MLCVCVCVRACVCVCVCVCVRACVVYTGTGLEWTEGEETFGTENYRMDLGLNQSDGAMASHANVLQ